LDKAARHKNEVRMMTKKKMGLLVMAYGTPYHLDDLERYYTHIRHGRKPTPEMIEELRNRYEAIGGISPLAKITIQQAKKTRRTNKSSSR
jgi:ferrochelatase